jgi:hypothetical protein
MIALLLLMLCRLPLGVCMLYCVCMCVYVAVIYICNDNVLYYGNNDNNVML